MERKQEKKITITLAVITCVIVAVILFLVLEAIMRAQAKRQSNLPLKGVDLSLLKAESSSQQNLIYSPLALKYGLATLRDGAGGDTKQQIETVLNTDNLPEYQDSKDTSSLVNAVAYKNDLKDSISEEYKKQVTDKYHADILFDDFKDGREIDRWLSQKSVGLVHGLGVHADEHTQMSLINSLTVQTEWKSGFTYEETVGLDFHKKDDKDMKAAMMHQYTKSDSVGYRKDGDTVVLTMDLVEHDNNKLQMVAVVPNNDLDQYIKEMNDSTLDSIQSTAKKTKKASEVKGGISLYMPRFRSDTELNVRSDLETLGMTDAFNEEKSDFSQMSQKKLTLGDIMHTANIDFREMPGALEEPETKKSNDNVVEIKLNRPFLFLIQNKDNDDVWFVGTMYEPEMWTQS